MVILLSNRKNKAEKEIIEILKQYGATYISDRFVSENNGNLTIISTDKKTNINLKKGIALFRDDTTPL